MTYDARKKHIESQKAKAKPTPDAKPPAATAPDSKQSGNPGKK